MKFYVYVHRHPLTKEVFYVGKGSGNRAFERNDRTDSWREVVRELRNQGLAYTIELVHICDTEEMALRLEIDEIKKYPKAVNIRNSHAAVIPRAGLNYNIILKDIGEKIQNERRNQNITQEALARSISISRTTLRNIEGGTGNAYEIGILLKILYQLNLHVRIP